MAPTDLFSSLAGGLGDEAYYQSQDPFFQGARSVAGWQNQPTNSSEAVWMPAVQGLLTGLLGGYGKQQAQEAAYRDYSSNPLLKALAGQTMGPLSEADALHDYTRPEMPEGWNTRIGKQDLQTAILGQTLAYEEQKRKNAILDEMQKSYASTQGKSLAESDAMMRNLPGLAGVPKELQSKVIEESGFEEAKKQSIDYVKQRYQDAKKLTGGWAGLTANTGVPTPSGNALSALADSVVVQIDAALGRELNSDVRKRMLNLAPKWYDSEEEIDNKAREMERLIASLKKSTPTLDLIRQGNAKIEQAPTIEAPTIDLSQITPEQALAELARRKAARGG